MSGDDEKGGTVRAVMRAIDILKSFDGANEPTSAAELARKTGLNRPTLYRLLNTLAEADMIRVAGEPQRFRLGPAAARLGQIWAAQIDINILARPILDELRDETGESASLFMLRDDRQVCVLESRSRQALSMSRGIGEMVDGFHGASGKVILAWLDVTYAKSLIKRYRTPELPEITLMELIEIRRMGYSVSHGAVFVGALAIAAPVFDRTGQIVGSLALYGPEARLSDERLPKIIERVVEEGARLSAELGHRTAVKAS